MLGRDGPLGMRRIPGEQIGELSHVAKALLTGPFQLVDNSVGLMRCLHR